MLAVKDGEVCSLICIITAHTKTLRGLGRVLVSTVTNPKQTQSAINLHPQHTGVIGAGADGEISAKQHQAQANTSCSERQCPVPAAALI